MGRRISKLQLETFRFQSLVLDSGSALGRLPPVRVIPRRYTPIGGGKEMVVESLPQFEGAAVRFLENNESTNVSQNETSPVVVKALRRFDREAVRNLLSQNSEPIKQIIHSFGAILFRGFPIHSEKEFENAVSGLPFFEPMSGYCMKEPGREPLPGHRHVFPTNTGFKTGGGILPICWFHSENYIAFDVPRYQSFWCKTPSLLGGETALLDLLHAYEALDERYRNELEAAPVETATFPVSQVAREYNISEQTVAEFFRNSGVTIKTRNNCDVVSLNKPCIFVHRPTGRKSLLMHLSAPEMNVNTALRDLIIKCYSSPEWAVHRFLWKHPTLMHFLSNRRPPKKIRNIPSSDGTPIPHTRWRMSEEERAGFAKNIATKISAFAWRAGDILILDNSRTAHTGLPGFGPRILRVILGNPIPIQFPSTSGIWDGDFEGSYESFHTRLLRLGRMTPKEQLAFVSFKSFTS